MSDPDDSGSESGASLSSFEERLEHNQFLPIHSLPTEILSRIFGICVARLYGFWPAKVEEDPRLCIGSVCSWWRAILLQQQDLWSIILYQNDANVRLWSRDWTDLCLKRSGYITPLHVAILACPNVVSELYDVPFSRLFSFKNDIIPHWQRITSMSLVLDEWELLNAILPLPESVSPMVSLDIEITNVRVPLHNEGTLKRLYLFNQSIHPSLIASNYRLLTSLSLSATALSIKEFSRLLGSLPTIQDLTLDSLKLYSEQHANLVQWPESLPPYQYKVSAPNLLRLEFTNSYIPSAIFDAPLIQSIKYNFSPHFDHFDAADFWPWTEELVPEACPALRRVELGDVMESTLHGFQSAAHFLRSYPEVPVMHLRGKEIADLLALTFGGGSAHPPRITAPGSSRFTGLTPPQALQTLEIDYWVVEEEEGEATPAAPPMRNTKELAELLLELLNNSHELVISWSTLCDPTSEDVTYNVGVASAGEIEGLRAAIVDVRKAIHKLLTKFPDRVKLHLA